VEKLVDLPSWGGGAR